MSFNLQYVTSCSPLKTSSKRFTNVLNRSYVTRVVLWEYLLQQVGKFLLEYSITLFTSCCLLKTCSKRFIKVLNRSCVTRVVLWEYCGTISVHDLTLRGSIQVGWICFHLVLNFQPDSLMPSEWNYRSSIDPVNQSFIP